MESEQDAGVVVPLVPLNAEPTTEVLLRSLLNREAILVTRGEATAAVSNRVGTVAETSGAFAKALSQATQQLGRTGTEGLYRVVLPTGSTVRNLVPAVGGGFRGLVRGAGSTKIVGHARLLPAAAGAGATVAAGPLIATVGLAMAGDMLAQHQINKKLDLISSAVERLHERMDEQEHSVLSTANQQSEKVVAYLLDRAQIPAISSASQAFGDLDRLANTYVSRLDHWLQVVHDYQHSDHVYGPELMNRLVNKRENQAATFELMIAQTYEALGIKARVSVLEKVAAEFTNPNQSLDHIENRLNSELNGIATRQSQLVGLLDDLSILPIDSSRVPIKFAGKGALDIKIGFARLTKALHSSPDSLPMLTESDQTILELAPIPKGLSIVKPPEQGSEQSETDAQKE